MKIVFCSNYMNHHQLPFCKALLATEGVEFTFIATEPVSEMRKNLGYQDMDGAFPWIIRAYENAEEYARAEKEVLSADVALFGNSPKKLKEKRLAQGKLSFDGCERFLKTEISALKGLLRKMVDPIRFNRKNYYLLCAGAYTAADYARFGGFKGKKYKWGYFPEVKKYEEIRAVLKAKSPRSILWAGRLIDWKHPEYALEIAKRLQADGYEFSLKIVGGGALENSLRDSIKKEGLQDRVKMLGAMPAGQVRDEMEKAEIFLFTSDKNEGWGAVLNESMNSACVSIASHAIGAAPYLIKDGENGFLFQDGDLDELYEKVKRIFNEPALSARLGENAYKSMEKTWNPENAAACFLALAKEKLYGEKSGLNEVCSVAEVLTDDWYLKTKQTKTK